MNSSAFFIWDSGVHPTVDVYPVSQLGVRNYSFTFTPTLESDAYSLVLVSRSNTSSTDVLLHIVVQQKPAASETLLVPGALIGLGVVSAGVGATRKPKFQNARSHSQASIRPSAL